MVGAGDILLVAKRDRLGRDVLNVALVERLVERRGGRVYSAAGEGTDDDGPTGQLMRTMVDAFAAYERAIIRVRTESAMAVAKAARAAASAVSRGATGSAAMAGRSNRMPTSAPRSRRSASCGRAGTRSSPSATS